MSVEQVGVSGTATRLLTVAGWVLVAVVGLLVLRDTDTVQDVVRPGPRPAPEVTVVRSAPSTLDEVRAGVGRQWGATFDELAAGLAVPVSARIHEDPAQGVRDSAGRLVGFMWDDAALVEGIGDGVPWLLSVEVMRRQPLPHAYPCAPERWGKAGAVVTSCQVRSGEGWQRVVATSVPAGGGGPETPGWTQAVDVRDGLLHVQVVLTRRQGGADPVPLTPRDLERLALHPAWHEE